MPRPDLLLLCTLAFLGCDTTYGFQPIQAGADDQRVPRPKSDGQFLRGLYADVLGRAPAVYEFVVTGQNGQELSRFPVDEGQDLLAVFDGVGDPAPLRAILGAGLLDSAEVMLPVREQVPDAEAFIAEQFRHLLGREPGTYELFQFADAWRSDPAVGPKTVIRAILASREYQSF